MKVVIPRLDLTLGGGVVIFFTFKNKNEMMIIVFFFSETGLHCNLLHN